MTDFYDSTLRSALQSEPDTLFQGITCGLSVCVGSVSVHGPAGEEALQHLHRHFALSSETPVFSMLEIDFGEKTDVHERRFIFSLDPAIRSISDRSATNQAQTD